MEAVSEVTPRICVDFQDDDIPCRHIETDRHTQDVAFLHPHRKMKTHPSALLCSINVAVTDECYYQVMCPENATIACANCREHETCQTHPYGFLFMCPT